MNSQHKVLCTHCGRLIPEAESDAHCATHEKTPTPAVASAERERPKCEDCSGTGNCGTCNGRGTRHPDNEPECKRAQADALDAQRYRELLAEVRDALDESLGDTDPMIDDEASDEEVRDEYPVFWACQQISLALRTSSPDPVVPRGEDGEKGK